MFRWIITLILLAVIVAAAGFLAREPGSVVVDWRGYHLEVSVAVAVLALLVLIAAVVLLFRLWWFVLRTPRSIARKFHVREQRRGYEAVSRGLVAVAAGDPENARRHARKAESLLEKKPLSMLLSAQSAQLDGDDQAAKTFFQSMQERWDTEFLGVRGLLTQAIKREDWAEALSLAKRAYTLNPKSPWVVETLYDLQKRTQQWSDAKGTLQEAKRLKLMPPEVIKTEMAEILYRKSLSADENHAIDEAKAAHKADPTFIPAAVRFASLLAGAGLTKRAARVVEDVWAENPDRQLAEVYFSAKDWEDPRGKLEVAKRLARANPTHMESKLIIGECAIQAKLWDEARANIEPYATDDASARVCRLMAQLEEGSGNDEAARDWLVRASGSPDLPAKLEGTGTLAAEEMGETAPEETASTAETPAGGAEETEVPKPMDDTPPAAAGKVA